MMCTIKPRLIAALALVMTESSRAQFDLRLQVQPAQPTPATPVSVTILDDFADSCYFVCAAHGAWIDPSTYHIDWSIQRADLICLPVITTRSSSFALGELAAGPYNVTATEFVTPVFQPCMSNPSPHSVQRSFRVFAVCDIDRDGATTAGDVGTFVNVLLGNDTNPSHISVCDLNADGRADGADIGAFVACAAG